MESKMSPSIFLCHASPDKGKIRRLYHELLEAGLDPWLDEENILPGQDWDLEIKRAIRKADYFLACLSSFSIDRRGYFHKEIKMALDILDEIPEGKVYLIPVRLDDCILPERLKKWQWVDLFGNRTRGFTRILMTIVNQHPSISGRLSLKRIEKGDKFKNEQNTITAKYERELENLIENGYIEKADMKTRNFLLYLAGPDAASRGYIQYESEMNNIPCSTLHNIYYHWQSESNRAFKKGFPRVFNPRKSEIEGRYFHESRLFTERLRHCGLESFIWYLRPDGEILSGPSNTWFYPNFNEIKKSNPIAYGILCLNSTLCSLFMGSTKVLLDGLTKIDTSNWLSDSITLSKTGIRRALLKLEELSFIYRLSENTYSLHNYVDNLTLNEIDDQTLEKWIRISIKAMDIVFPDPDDSGFPNSIDNIDWTFESSIYSHFRFYHRRGVGSNRSFKIWEKESHSTHANSLKIKLGVYIIRNKRYVGWQREAENLLQEAIGFFKEKSKIKLIEKFLDELKLVSG